MNEVFTEKFILNHLLNTINHNKFIISMLHALNVNYVHLESMVRAVEKHTKYKRNKHFIPKTEQPIQKISLNSLCVFYKC